VPRTGGLDEKTGGIVALPKVNDGRNRRPGILDVVPIPPEVADLSELRGDARICEERRGAKRPVEGR